jgi:hypothetical protein
LKGFWGFPYQLEAFVFALNYCSRCGGILVNLFRIGNIVEIRESEILYHNPICFSKDHKIREHCNHGV